MIARAAWVAGQRRAAAGRRCRGWWTGASGRSPASPRRSGRTGAGSGRRRRSCRRRRCRPARAAPLEMKSATWSWSYSRYCEDRVELLEERLQLAERRPAPSSASRSAGRPVFDGRDQRVEVAEEAAQVGRQRAHVAQRRLEVAGDRAQVAGPAAACSSENVCRRANVGLATRRGTSGRSGSSRRARPAARRSPRTTCSPSRDQVAQLRPRSRSARRTSTPVFLTSRLTAPCWSSSTLQHVGAVVRRSRAGCRTRR